jgi:hypothetical protein
MRVRAYAAFRNTNKVHTWAQTAAGNIGPVTGGASPAAELPRLGEGGGESDMARRRQLHLCELRMQNCQQKLHAIDLRFRKRARPAKLMKS